MDDAEKIRLKGNEVYKTGNVALAQSFYLKALALSPGDPTIISNLSSAQFELGEYQECLDSLKPLKSEELNSQISNTKKQQLQLREAKCLFYLNRFNECLDVVEILCNDLDLQGNIKSQAEAIQNFLDMNAKANKGEELRTRTPLDNFPFYRQAFFNDNIEYFINGNDFSESLFTKKDVNMFHGGSVPEELSLYFGGVGDARNFYPTMFELAGMFDKLREKDTLLKFTLVDIKPEVMGRNLIILKCMHEALMLEPLRGSERELERLTYQSLIFYVYSAPIMPAMVYEKLQKIMRDFVGISSKVDLERYIPWVDIDPESKQKIDNVFSDWLGKGHKTMDTKMEHIDFKEDKSSDAEPQARRRYLFSKYPFLHREILLFPKCMITFPTLRILKAEPDLKMWFNNREHNKIVTYVRKNWKENVTWRDIRTEERYGARRGLARFPLDDPVYHLNHLINQNYNQFASKLSKESTSIDVAIAFFSKCYQVVKLLGAKVTFRVGDAYKVLLSMPEKSLDAVHLSNVPEYTGGYLSLCVCAATRLKPTGYAVSNLMRYTFAYDSFDHVISHSMCVDSRKAAADMYGMELSKRNTEFPKPSVPSSGDSYPAAVTPGNINSYYGGVGFDPNLGQSNFDKDVANMATVGEYYAWASIEEKKSLPTKAAFVRLAYQLFFKALLPPKQEIDKVVFHHPLSAMSFVRTMDFFLTARKFPAHWISYIFETILSGNVETSARAPPNIVLIRKTFGLGFYPDPQLKQPHPVKSISTASFVPELEAALASCTFDAKAEIRIPVLTKLLPTDLTEYEIGFHLFVRYNALEWNQILALVFFDSKLREKLNQPGKLREILVDGEASENKNIFVYSCFQLIDDSANDKDLVDPVLAKFISEKMRDHRLARKAKFTMSKARMEKMKGNGWMVGVWRVDSWCPQDCFSYEFVRDAREDSAICLKSIEMAVENIHH